MELVVASHIHGIDSLLNSLLELQELVVASHIHGIDSLLNSLLELLLLYEKNYHHCSLLLLHTNLLEVIYYIYCVASLNQAHCFKPLKPRIRPVPSRAAFMGETTFGNLTILATDIVAI